MRKWTVLGRRKVFAAEPWLAIYAETVELPDGRVIEDYFRIEALDAANVVAIDDEGRFLLLRQYKHGVGETTLTLPGGHLEHGEAPLAAAKRELLEETGYEASEWRPLARLVAAANQRGAVDHMFLARGLRKVAAPRHGDLEEMELIELDAAALRTAIRDGRVTLSSHVAGLAMVLADLAL